MSKINYQDWFEEIKEHIIRDTEKRVVCDVIEIIENYRCHDKTYERVGMIEQIRKKYGVRDD